MPAAAGACTPSAPRRTISGTPNGPRGLTLADLDRDGGLDALSASTDDHTVAWYDNNGAGTSWTAYEISTLLNGTWSVATGDLDRDGDLDVVAGGAGEVAWYLNDGMPEASGWTSSTIEAAAVSVRSVDVGDIDGGGDTDVVSRYDVLADSAARRRTRSRGAPASLQRAHRVRELQRRRHLVLQSGGAGCRHRHDPRFRGRRHPRRRQNRSRRIHRRPAARLAEEQRHRPLPRPHHDLGHGARRERAGARRLRPRRRPRPARRIVLRRHVPDLREPRRRGSSWTVHTLATSADGPSAVSADDVDADGDLDAVAATPIDDRHAWYENDGAGGGWTVHTFATIDQASAVAAADFDRDGDLDAVGASCSAGQLVTARNDRLHGQSLFAQIHG